MQCCHRRSPNWRETNNLSAILTPPEVFTPALLARMKQWGHEATEGVTRHGPHGLMTVTTLARQGKIVVLRQTACLAGNNMVNREGLRRIFGLATAIFTTGRSTRCHQTPQRR
jgi:hypothetical protein